jgi:hypothetical protein
MRYGGVSVFVSALITLFGIPGLASAQPVTASHHAGLLTIQCNEAPLETVFTRIEQEAGVELILEDSVKSKRLSADLVDVPIAMAVQRLLEGAGVNYAVMMDPMNWGRVDKIFVGAGGGGPSRPAPPPPRQPVRPSPAENEMDEFEEMDELQEALDEMENFDEGMDGMDMENPEDFEDPADLFPTPDAGTPNYLPNAPSFPRSRFTPGLPGNQQQQQPQPPPSDPSASPDQGLPFLDPFGRPIPTPGVDPNDPNDPNAQPRQRQRRQ